MRSKLLSLLAASLLIATAFSASAQEADSRSDEKVDAKETEVDKVTGSKTLGLGPGPLKNIFDDQDALEAKMKAMSRDTEVPDVLIEVDTDKKVLLVSLASSSLKHYSVAKAELMSARKTVGTCAKTALSKRTKPGEIRLEVDVDDSGEVEDVRVTKNNLGDDAADCLDTTLAKAKYPKLKNTGELVTISVVGRWDANYNSSQDCHGELKVGRGTGAMGSLQVDGSLSKSEVARVLKAKSNATKYCYEKELQRCPELAGEVDIRLTISEKGRVTEAAVVKSTLASLASRKVEGCLWRVHKRMRFPKPAKEVEVSYRLTFSRAE